ncbi:hypothetical protein FDP41_008188 [Naegleria fowleri]|uniref:RecA family profile 1 domain-containing protein n=1 Tax=Naegleria fowleri TaxID=5763 RepID=A0A6A5BHI1_NAEFO|nr:uncharacterized protein FDP41_008188 [Naegleria fowleri]KAF0973484.1 hypothetical protein FDP41_008188 [Naegleria fowleri]CAG4710620.1 unnamed protein product [Naegleria fowleri]
MPLLLEHRSAIPSSLYKLLIGSGINSVEEVVFSNIGNLLKKISRFYASVMYERSHEEISSEQPHNQHQIVEQPSTELTRQEIVMVEDVDENQEKTTNSDLSNIKFDPTVVKKQLYILQEYFISRYAPKSVSVEQMLLNNEKTQIQPLNTGSGTLDMLLGSGIHIGELTEILGYQSSGKTSLCMTVALNSIIEKNSNTVLWISSNSSFNARDFAKLYEAKSTLYREQIRQSQLESQTSNSGDGNDICSLCETLYKIRVLDIMSALELKSMLLELVNIIESGQDAFYNTLRLVVIDSLAVILSQLFPTRVNSKVSEKEDCSFDELIRLMKKIARKYHIAFLYTNYTINEMDDRTTLGESCKYFSHVRLLCKRLEKQPINEEGTFFEAKLIKSPRRSLTHPRVFFQVMSLGVVDVIDMNMLPLFR